MDVGHGFVGRTGEHGRPFRPGDAAQPEAEGLPIGRRRSLHVTGHAAAKVPSFTEFYRVLPSFSEFFSWRPLCFPTDGTFFLFQFYQPRELNHWVNFFLIF